ncbi:MAG: hypothetical protein R3D26_12740 [Cyanobacteriota/Melainabacteria group bacterium]
MWFNKESAYFQSNGFGKFAKLSPIGGAGGSGIDLSVVATPMAVPAQPPSTLSTRLYR